MTNSNLKGMLSPILEGNGVCLRAIEEQDLEMVRQWRNDPKISQFMLTQHTISIEQQKQWYEHIRDIETQQHFVIEYKQQPIGIANIRTLSGDQLLGAETIEPGLYIYDDRYRGSFLAFCPALTLNDYCFDTLRCNKIIARVLPNNDAAFRFNAMLGYAEVSREELITMELLKAQYQLSSEKIRKFIRY